jgi:hypothetical protein
MASFEDLKFYPQDQLGYYCDANSNTTCRICLEKSQNNKKMCNIFDGAEPIFNMIMSCASVQVSATPSSNLAQARFADHPGRRLAQRDMPEVPRQTERGLAI